MCAQPFPLVPKSSVNSFPLLIPVTLPTPSYKTAMMKSPECVVVTGAPGMVVLTMLPKELLTASGLEVEIPETSQDVISTCVGEPAKVGVMTVAPGMEFTANQVSTESGPIAARAPAEM